MDTQMYGGASSLPPVVFIPGSGDSAQVWRPLLARLPGVAAYALDLPGHGSRLSEALVGEASVSGYATWVANDLRRQGMSRAIVCGHSLGGAIALQLALDHPALVSKICLMGSGARLRVAPAFLEAALQGDPRGSLEFTRASFTAAHLAQADQFCEERAPVAAGALHRDLTACDRFDVMARLSEIQQPTLVIVGVEDRLTPVKYAEFLRERLPDAALALIPDAGHYAQLEQPEAVAGAIIAWLA